MLQPQNVEECRIFPLQVPYYSFNTCEVLVDCQNHTHIQTLISCSRIIILCEGSRTFNIQSWAYWETSTVGGGGHKYGFTIQQAGRGRGRGGGGNTPCIDTRTTGYPPVMGLMNLSNFSSSSPSSTSNSLPRAM